MMKSHRRLARTAANPVYVDLQTQLESLLNQVWRCEADWRREDRVDRAVRYGDRR